MDIHISQPMLFDFADTATGAVEFFPEIWNATEALTSPSVAKRHAALERLIELNAPRLSPLVAYVIASRIIDPDLAIRLRVVQVIGQILTPDADGRIAPEAVRAHLKGYYAEMGLRGVKIMLEVAEQNPVAEADVAAVLNSCSHMGTLLTEIMHDRRSSIPVRQQAINFIGRVGYIQAIPAMERLIDRLETRVNGQKSMPFAPNSDVDERSLLPVAQATLALLRVS